MKAPDLSFSKLLFPLLFLTLFAQAVFAQQKGTIKGTINTAKNQPAENVTVTIKGTNNATVTNEEGKFSLKALPGDYTLVVSHVGMRNNEIPVTVKAAQVTTVPFITVDLSVSALNEVNVSGNKTNKFSRKQSIDVAKMPLNNLENSQSYTSVSKELLDEQAVFSADDAIKNSPGITTLWTPTARAGDGGSYFTLRGFSTQILLRNGLSGNVGTAVDDANLDKIEIIKGPSGTLYGSTLTSFGGLINRVTKKPFDTVGGSITYSTGGYNFNRLAADFNSPLDSAKKALLRINTAYNTTSSFQDNGFNRSFAFDPSFTYKISDKLTLTFEAEINHVVATTPTIFYFGSTIAALGATNANQLSINYKDAYQGNNLATTSNNANFFGQINYKMSDNWKSQTSISSTNNSSNGYGAFFYLLAGNSSISRDVWDVDGRSNTLQIQQNFNGDFKIGNMRNRFLGGVDFINQSEDIAYINPNNGSDLFDVVNTRGAIPNYGNFNKTKVDSLFNNRPTQTFYSHYNTYTYSAYASDVLNITENLLAMASLRMDHFVTRPIADPTSGTSSQGYNQTVLSPKFGLVYQIVKNQVSLFGNYQNGFSNPGYYLTYDAASNSNVSKLFKSEQANQWEGGVKLDLFEGKLSSTISYYDIKVTNEIAADPFHANASIQNGTQYSKGFEAEVTANPFKGFNIIAGYAYNDSKKDGLRPETAGPANTANLWLSYTLTSGDAKGLGIGFGGNYAGNNQIINDSYYGKFFLPSYTVLNGGVFFNKERYRLSLNVNNLTNKEYYVGYTTVDPQMLRQVIGSIAYKF